MNNRIKAIMAKAFEIPIEQITDSSSQDTVESWDSIHHVKMIVFLEREFDIVIPDEEVSKMLNYKFIENIIKKHYESTSSNN